MAADFDIVAGPEWGQFAKELKSSTKVIEREVSKGMQRSIHRVTNQVRASAATTLPRSGGLGTVVAASTQFLVRTNVVGPAIRVSLHAVSSYDISQMDHGEVNHPVYGNRRAWVRQQVTPLWFTAPVEKSEPDFRMEMHRAVNRIVNQLEKSR